ncbi:MAG: DNA polymerase III subunit epsilon [Legionellales bacterium]|nr:DNA polymerase III subunit epsilon [Legionellales bacterium]
MKQIVLDTETTGLEPKQGHRIIEIGCVELINRRETKRNFHQYLNPEREIEDGAYNVHGLSNEFLSDKPRFADIAQDFIDFIKDSELIIHNAPFDVGFINSELRLMGKKWGQVEDYCKVFDTLLLAREKHPGQKNNLDALCKRYDVDNSNRDLHGALLDAEILLDVYLGMTGGQTDLSLEQIEIKKSNENENGHETNKKITKEIIIEPTKTELSKHQLLLESIQEKSGGKCIWIENEID